MDEKRKIKILCTVGPATLNESALKALAEEGVDLLRINLSHTPLEEVEKNIGLIRRHVSIPICIDSEGAQLRTGVLKGGTRVLEEGEILVIPDDLPLNHPHFISEIAAGERLHIDFDAACVEVTQKRDGKLICRVVAGGKIGSNKALNPEKREIFLPALTQKDKEALSIGRRLGVRHVALSFANDPADVLEMRKTAGDDFFLISKIESNRGLKNLEAICRHSDALLLDRGDLSREQPIQRIPFWQKKIVAVAKQFQKEVYVATNLLESMVREKIPTRAEVSDVANALLDGVDGLVLAAETAIGRNPVLCVRMIGEIIKEYQSVDSLDWKRYWQ